MRNIIAGQVLPSCNRECHEEIFSSARRRDIALAPAQRIRVIRIMQRILSVRASHGYGTKLQAFDAHHAPYPHARLPLARIFLSILELVCQKTGGRQCFTNGGLIGGHTNGIGGDAPTLTEHLHPGDHGIGLTFGSLTPFDKRLRPFEHRMIAGNGNGSTFQVVDVQPLQNALRAGIPRRVPTDPGRMARFRAPRDTPR
jgi:hypothetical protein